MYVMSITIMKKCSFPEYFHNPLFIIHFSSGKGHTLTLDSIRVSSIITRYRVFYEFCLLCTYVFIFGTRILHTLPNLLMYQQETTN